MGNKLSILRIENINKTYKGGVEALKDINLEVETGEIMALLGPNGAGKTTLISLICGLVVPTSGKVTVGGFDIAREYRKARNLIGLVPQELAVDGFESVFNALRFSRALFGKPPNDDYLEKMISDLSLTDKRDAPIITLSGGMKRRILIAKALAHEPELLFLDEPTAGVDVSLRKDLWAMIEGLRQNGTTIILTTHYIEEAEEMADRVGIINHGALLLVEEKTALMKRMGKKELRISLDETPGKLPASLKKFGLELDEGGLIYQYDTKAERTGIRTLLNAVHKAGLGINDIDTRQSSLEEIFVELVGE